MHRVISFATFDTSAIIHYSMYKTEFTVIRSLDIPRVTSNARVPSFMGANQDSHSMCFNKGTSFASDSDAVSARRSASGIASVRHCLQSEAQGSYCGLFRRAD
ncbi:hypothetical protein RSAG8_00616, partial [Rhizoctonia solani AG-8 WAC10335]